MSMGGLGAQPHYCEEECREEHGSQSRPVAREIWVENVFGFWRRFRGGRLRFVSQGCSVAALVLYSSAGVPAREGAGTSSHVLLHGEGRPRHRDYRVRFRLTSG